MLGLEEFEPSLSFSNLVRSIDSTSLAAFPFSNSSDLKLAAGMLDSLAAVTSIPRFEQSWTQEQDLDAHRRRRDFQLKVGIRDDFGIISS